MGKTLDKQFAAAQRREAEAKHRQARLVALSRLGDAVTGQRKAKADEAWGELQLHAQRAIECAEALKEIDALPRAEATPAEGESA